jgi:hypothetical protein
VGDRQDPFLDWVLGVLQQPMTCPVCNGDGVCCFCDANGKAECGDCNGTKMCPQCNGSGKARLVLVEDAE